MNEIHVQHHKLTSFIVLFATHTKSIISWVHVFCTWMLCIQNKNYAHINRVKYFQPSMCKKIEPMKQQFHIDGLFQFIILKKGLSMLISLLIERTWNVL